MARRRAKCAHRAQGIRSCMNHLSLAETSSSLALTGTDRTIVVAVGLVAVIALIISFILRAGVLAANKGSERMQEISAAVQEGAAAYLTRQFKTLSVFVVVVFVLLLVLPADSTAERIGRSIFFLIGAGFSATIGYTGMWLA